MSQTLKDALSRALWTAAQAALGLLAATGFVDNLPDGTWWAIPLATALSFIKSFVATKVGDPSKVTFE